MKKIELYNLERTMSGEGSPKVRLSSLMFMRTAITFNNENLKGLEKIAKAAHLLAKLDAISPEAEEVLLEDAEFNLLKDSVDKCQNFGIGILLFPEFIDSIRNPVEMDINKK